SDPPSSSRRQSFSTAPRPRVRGWRSAAELLRMSVVSAEIEITEVPFGSAAYHEVTDLRRAILRTPLGLDFTPEELAWEREDTHLAARMRDRVVGTLLLRAMDARTTRLMRMAVEEDMRGHSIGRRLVTHAEALLRNRGIET